MHSIREIADFTGFSRDAITTRVRRWNLDAERLSVKDVLTLKPLNGASEAMTLEKARIENTQLSSEKIKIELETYNRERLLIEELSTALNATLSETRATIEASPLSQGQKDDIIDTLATIPERIFGK